MTGEVTLRGRVLPIGGLKEKLLAALRGGIKMVLIPAENEKDLAEIPANVKEGLAIIPVSHVDEVLARALTAPLSAIVWTEADDIAAQPVAASLEGRDAALRQSRRMHQSLAIERVNSTVFGMYISVSTLPEWERFTFNTTADYR